MNWTEKQKEVIDSNGSDLLVAAAAGSGKTAVLVERIKRLIIEEKKDIDRFLVVTFTRAAASEMKEKIADALISQAGDDPDTAEEMQIQLEKLGEAWISTFDSFIIDIVRQYFYIIDIEPDLEICSPEDAALINIESMDETFDRLYAEGREEVIRFLDAYSSPKSDKMLKEKLMDLYDSLRAMPGCLDWLEESIRKLKIDKEDLKSGAMMDQLLQTVGKNARKAAGLLEEAYEILDLNGIASQAKRASEELEQVERCTRFRDFEEACELFGSVTFPRISVAKSEKEDYELIKKDYTSRRDNAKKIISDTKEMYLGSLNDAVSRINATAPFASTLLSILKMYEQISIEKRLDKGQMDFSDASHFALEILKNKDAASEIRDRFDYIFIDEYQDSNYIQEAIISSIKKENNLFMVGDIKQSIYGFRLAEPDIFRDRYKRYALYADEGIGRKIDLNTNFRSKQSVIDTVNDLFGHIMPDYDEDAMLYKGDAYEGPIVHKSEMHIIDKQAILDSVQTDPFNINDAADLNELKKLKNIEYEAHLAARLIKENLGRKIYDSKTGEERPVRKKDIVILLRYAKNRADKVYDILMQNGIEAIIDDNSGYFDSVEIETLSDMLRVIDNRHQDIPLLSVLRSGIFGFTIDELIKIRLYDTEGDFFDCMNSFAAAKGESEQGSNTDRSDIELRAKAAETIDKINSWSERSVYMTTDELLSEIISSSGYYAYSGALSGGLQRQANIRQFIEKAAEFDSKGNGTIFSFLKYLDVIRQNTDSSQAQISDDSDDAVRILTIHKSKGLEFPVVIVCGLGETFRKEKTDAPGIWHKDLGFAMRCVDLEHHCYYNTLLQRLIIDKKNQDNLDEEIRVLYVACTRAKEKLILLGTRGNAKSTEASYLNILEPVIDRKITEVKEYADNSADEIFGNDVVSPEKDSETQKRDSDIFDLKMNRLPENNDVNKRVVQMLDFRYPHETELEVKSKYSVSELNAGDDLHIELKRPGFAMKDQSIGGAAFGTLMHFVMERLDFNKVFEALGYAVGSPGASSPAAKSRARECIEDCVQMLVQENAISEKEADAVNVDKIIRFFESSLGKRIAAAEELHKEKPFNILHEKDGHEIIVQGIIDCYFIEEDDTKEGEQSKHIVLLDYKTNYNTEGIEDIYREQLSLYKEALEKSTGLKVSESYLYLFSEDRAVIVDADN